MRYLIIAAVALVAIIAAGVTAAHGAEQAQVRFAAGTFTIDHTTCAFAHQEQDYPLGNSWLEGRVAFAYEDVRHDTLDACNRARTTRIARCLTTLPHVSQAPADKQGYHDERGLVQLRAYIESCVAHAAL